MSIQLTREQQAVVDDRGGRLLVSAAAGSGKTRVLVDRLFSRVLGEEKANVDDFLIITYTRAAAAELRGRIAQELGKRLAEHPGNRHLQRQLLLVYQADIKTIDAFCTALLRENVHLLDFGEGRGLTADFRVLDESEADLLRRRVLPRVLEEFYTDMTPGAEQLADAFGFGRDDGRLEELVLTLHDKIQSHAYPEKWLEEQKKIWADLPGDVGETVYGRELLAALSRKARHWANLLRLGAEECACDEKLQKGYAPAFLTEAGHLEGLAAAADTGWDEAGDWELTFPSLSPVRKCEAPELKAQLQSQWNRCKKEMKAAVSIWDASAAEAAEDLRRSAPAMEALLDLCAAFGRAYQGEKLRRNVTDFSDQEHAAVRLLLGEDGEPTELSDIVSGRYLEVMVDEYQDTNQVQNCIFEAVSQGGRRLFTVGDVKQSIYRFRLADPTIFLEKYTEYPPSDQAADGEPRKILLSKNFRSRQPVLDAVNFVFGAIMSREMGEMDYGEEEALHLGAEQKPERADCAVEFHMLGVPRGGEEPVSRPLAEARFVVGRIREMLDEGFPVTDGDTGQLRPCRAEDMAVLMRSPGPRLRHYLRAMAEAGIPCAVQESEDFFASMEVAVLYSLLQILDNPRQDVPLIAVLRSPVFGFSPDRLAVIRGNHPQGDFYAALEADSGEDSKAFLDQLTLLRREAKDLSVHGLLWRIFDRLNILGIFGAMEGGEQRRENLITLCEYARSFEQAGYRGLFAIVSQLRRLLENGQQPTVSSGSAMSGVQIMSIHRSKGLEFPIVFLADLDKPFNRTDLQSPVLVHPQLGLGPMFIDLDRHIRYPTAAHRAVGGRLSREMRAEEMRLLYVGMTRAREKLILVASTASPEKKLQDLTALSALPVPPETVDGAKSMAEWVLLPLLARREAVCLRAIAGMEEGTWSLTEDLPWMVSFHEIGETVSAEDQTEVQPERPSDQGPEPDREALSFTYPYAAACEAPTKLTATQLKGREKDQEIAENSFQPYVRRSLAAPRFLSGKLPLTAEERGTAVHLVMQYLPLDGDVDAVIDDLLQRRLLTEDQAQAVDRDAVRRFLSSPLAEELRQAEHVEREYRFSLLVPASDYELGLGEEEILLQGVVDLFGVTHGAVTVVDFKTDRVSGRDLARRAEEYRPQLQAYSRALEQILELPVTRRVLYFFHAGEAVEL